MSKNCLKWITISSEQAMLMSVCLQGMVDELLNQKDGTDLNNIQVGCLSIFETLQIRLLNQCPLTDAHNPPTAANIHSS